MRKAQLLVGWGWFAVDGRSNQLMAVLELPETLVLDDCIVTVDRVWMSTAEWPDDQGVDQFWYRRRTQSQLREVVLELSWSKGWRVAGLRARP